jgi:hypothetical protein
MPASLGVRRLPSFGLSRITRGGALSKKLDSDEKQADTVYSQDTIARDVKGQWKVGQKEVATRKARRHCVEQSYERREATCNRRTIIPGYSTVVSPLI